MLRPSSHTLGRCSCSCHARLRRVRGDPASAVPIRARSPRSRSPQRRAPRRCSRSRRSPRRRRPSRRHRDPARARGSVSRCARRPARTSSARRSPPPPVRLAHDAPGGRRARRLAGVTSTDLPERQARLGQEGELGAWTTSGARRLAIRVDLSARRLQLVNGDRVLRTATVGIGRPGSATPTGRFAVTDKLNGGNYGRLLRLLHHRPLRPPAEPSARLARRRPPRHPRDEQPRRRSAPAPRRAACTPATSALRTLMRRVPLGTPVFIRG